MVQHGQWRVSGTETWSGSRIDGSVELKRTSSGKGVWKEVKSKRRLEIAGPRGPQTASGAPPQADCIPSDLTSSTFDTPLQPSPWASFIA